MWAAASGCRVPGKRYAVGKRVSGSGVCQRCYTCGRGCDLSTAYDLNLTYNDAFTLR